MNERHLRRVERPMLGLATLLVSQLFASAATPAADETGEIAIAVTGLQSSDGKVVVLLFDDESGFPTKPGKAIRKAKAKVSGRTAAVRLQDVPPGQYAVSVFHDENANGELDTNWLGIPKEGVGASNNAKGKMGPPKYKDAAFEVGSGTTVQRIKVQYL